MNYVICTMLILSLAGVCGARIITVHEGEVWTIPGEFQECSSEDSDVAVVITSSGQRNLTVTSSNDVITDMTSSTIRGEAIGVTTINCETGLGEKVIHVKVEHRNTSTVKSIYRIMIIVVIVLLNIGMGCELEFKEVLLNLKKPIAPLLGLFCQFVCMPLIFYGSIKLLDIKGGVAFGLIAIGCSPGGGSSNMYTLIFGGNFSLSVTMTFISNIVCLVTMPSWMYLLANKAMNRGDGLEEFDVVIPYLSIVVSLLSIAVPQCIGLTIAAYRKPIADKIRYLLKPFIYFVVVFFLSFSLYLNYHILSLLRVKYVVAGVLSPYAGFFVGGIIAAIFKQNKANIITISLETGLQNVTIALLVCIQTLKSSEMDYAMLGIISSGLFTPIPFYCGLIYVAIKSRIDKKKSSKEQAKEKDIKTIEELEQFKTNHPTNI